jgi:prepilin-type N-terminal cleavage/methylation domain-containing protein
MKTKKSGFTLVELMIVVIIVGILAAVAVPLMSANRDKARNSEAIAAIGAVSTAGRLFLAETGAAPDALADLVGAGLFDEDNLDGTYFTSTSYGGWEWADDGRVTQATADIGTDTWTFTWDAGQSAFTSTK